MAVATVLSKATSSSEVRALNGCWITALLCSDTSFNYMPSGVNWEGEQRSIAQTVPSIYKMVLRHAHTSLKGYFHLLVSDYSLS
jgi:hypothetical protein